MAARWSDRTRFAVTVLVILVPTIAWSIATPRYAVPDERDHVVKAAALARGHVLMDQVAGQPEWSGQADLPAGFAQGDTGCFNFKDDTTAACQRFAAVSGGTEVGTRARLYPPLYYVVPGLPSLVVTNNTAVYAMRAASALVVSLLVAAAAWLLRRTAAPRLAVVGLLVAFTPMAIYSNAGVNPSGLEISAALLFWVAGYLVMTRGPTERLPLVLMAVAASALVVSRPLSWLWFGLIALAVIVLGGVTGVRRLLGDRGGRRAVIAVGVVCVVQAAYIVAAGLLKADNDPGRGIDAPTSEILQTLIGHIWTQVRQMIGLFGYVDTQAPMLVYLGWLFLVGGLLVLAACVARRRLGLVLLATLVGTVIIPIALEVRAAPTSGYLWQGRYTLPIAVGVPLLCGFALAASPAARAMAGRRLPWLGVGVVVVAHIAAFYWALRRYTVSNAGSLFIWEKPEWTPPGGIWPVLIVATLSFVALGWWLAGSGRFSLYGGVPEPAIRVAVTDANGEPQEAATALR